MEAIRTTLVLRALFDLVSLLTVNRNLYFEPENPHPSTLDP